MELVAKVEDPQRNAESEWHMSRKGLEGLFFNGYDKQVYRSRTEQLADATKTLKRATEPVELFSVLCHGDFGRHNLLFRYDDDGRPLDALIIDLALIRYGSPALDLSYLVYLNTDRQTRDDHWDELLDVYCETLTSVAGNAVVPDGTQPEIREHGFCGLALASLSSRILSEDQKPFDAIKLVGVTDGEALQFWLSNGGQKASEWIADIVQHHLDMAYTY